MGWLAGLLSWDWQKIDDRLSSLARPYQQYLCSTSIAAALIIIVLKTNDALAIAAVAVPCSGLAGFTANLRSTDKKTAASLEIAKIQPSNNTVTTEVK